MVKMNLDATLRVAAGPTLAVGTALEPKSYSVAQLELAAEGAPADATKEVPLVPTDSDPVLLCVRVRAADDQPGTAKLVPKNGTTDGDEIEITGALIIGSKEVLEKLVANGPRVLAFSTVGAKPVTVDVIVAMD